MVTSDSITGENSQLSKPSRPLKIFYSYAPNDKELQKGLETHLALLRHQGHIIECDEYNVPPGKDFKIEISKHLQTADIILLLLSPDFIASKHCYEQMEQALKRHNTGKTRIIPIILRPIPLDKMPIHRLRALPSDGKPVTQWEDQDQAFLEIFRGIDTVVSGLINWIDVEILDLLKEFNKHYFQMEKTEEDWVKEMLDRMRHPSDYFNTVNKVEALTEDVSSIWWSDVLTPPVLFLFEQKVSENYLKHIKRAFRLTFGYREHDIFDDFEAYHANLMNRHFQAKIAYKRTLKVLRQDPNNIEALYVQSIALVGLGKNEEALAFATQVQKLDPCFPFIYDLVCTIYAHLGYIDEALGALEQAVHSNPGDVKDYNKVKIALKGLRKPVRWLQLTLPPQKEPLALPQLAASLFLSQIIEEEDITLEACQSKDHPTCSQD